MKTTTGRAPEPVDVHVGQAVRARREALGMSQTGLGECLGLTFQQIQKYERGINRVSASKLFAIAQVLEISVASFFPDQVPSAPSRLDDLAARAVARWGAEKQWDMVEEEALELALEVHRRARDKTTPEKIADEVADVEIMAAQARVMLPAGMVDMAKARKLEKLRVKLDGPF